MSDHDGWLIPNLLRRTGLHVIAGDGADEVAAALFCKGHAKGASVLLAEPRWTGLLHDLEWNPECALRTEHAIIVPAHPLWRPPTVESRLANADVALVVRDGLILTLRGGMANARPVEVATLVPPTIRGETSPPAPPAKPKPRPKGYPIRGWRGRMWRAWDQWQREAWERGERDGSRP